MDSILSALDAAGFRGETFLQASLILSLSMLVLGFIARFAFGKRSAVNHAVSSAIGILFFYALTVVLYSAGAEFQAFVAPLPFIQISGEQLAIFSFQGADYTVVCSELLSMIILAFLVNLLDTVLPKGKGIFSWFFFRCATVFLALVLHLIVTWLFTTFLPAGIVTYAPTILLILLVVMLAVGALKLLVGIALSSVSPLVGFLYTFFFATMVGKQLSKAMLTTLLLAALVLALNYIGLTVISIASAALVAYIPLLLILAVIWYLVNQLL